MEAQLRGDEYLQDRGSVLGCDFASKPGVACDPPSAKDQFSSSYEEMQATLTPLQRCFGMVHWVLQNGGTHGYPIESSHSYKT